MILTCNENVVYYHCAKIWMIWNFLHDEGAKEGVVFS